VLFFLNTYSAPLGPLTLLTDLKTIKKCLKMIFLMIKIDFSLIKIYFWTFFEKITYPPSVLLSNILCMESGSIGIEVAEKHMWNVLEEFAAIQ
jgi:hypothetical protein